MGIFKTARMSAPPEPDVTAGSQERLASIGEMMSAQTRAAYAAAATPVAVRLADRRTVTIAGMRQIAMVNFDMLMEFELTVLPDGMPPYPAVAQQLVSPRAARQLVPGLTLEASVDPADPGTVCLDLGSLN